MTQLVRALRHFMVAPRTTRAHGTMSALLPGEKARVCDVNAKGAVRQRLLDMGLLPGTIVTVERWAPLGDPIWINLGSSQIALRRHEADAIAVVRAGGL